MAEEEIVVKTEAAQQTGNNGGTSGNAGANNGGANGSAGNTGANNGGVTESTVDAGANTGSVNVNAEGGSGKVAEGVKKKKKKKLPKKVIVLENVGVRFNIQEQKVDNLKEFFIRMVKRTLRYKEFWALRNINLTVRKGDRVGILGLNGAGKSTLLKCIAGVLKPSEGKVSVTGNIVPLLELGAGFDKDYTGAENIFLYGSMLGYSRQFLKEKFNEIVEFSELGDFINVPVKNYSSGMKARLGFSIATVVEPEILILDEVLSVGDARFRKKSAKKLKKMMKKGVTVLFVSHSAEQVVENCNKAIILENGKLIASGKAVDISAKYEQMISRTAE